MMMSKKDYPYIEEEVMNLAEPSVSVWNSNGIKNAFGKKETGRDLEQETQCLFETLPGAPIHLKIENRLNF